MAETGQPYAYTADDPLNETDPLGLGATPSRADLKWNAKYGCGIGRKKKCHGISVSSVAKHVAHAVHAATHEVQQFGEDHLSVSAEACFHSCVGISLQDGRFQGISGNGGALFGAGASINVTTGPPAPQGSDSRVVGLATFEGSWGSAGGSVGFGPGAIVGFGQQTTSPPFG